MFNLCTAHHFSFFVNNAASPWRFSSARLPLYEIERRNGSAKRSRRRSRSRRRASPMERESFAISSSLLGTTASTNRWVIRQSRFAIFSAERLCPGPQHSAEISKRDFAAVRSLVPSPLRARRSETHAALPRRSSPDCRRTSGLCGC
jgi:hypothetical protein